ncbi:MAG: HU family DNA-binding protein [Prevotellaceae bacterium]|jgi:predicted histone-like DNA-binding protein|nr:HU family DNA-binding protein [Prevotellaceae bacterium]
MPILFNRVERGNPQNPVAPKKWYPVLKTISRLEEKDVAREIADETTLNRKEAEMALDQLEKVLIRNLLASNSVQIGDWGTFHLTCNGAGADSKEALTAGNIKNLNIRFVPGKSLKDALTKATFIPAESVVSKSQ